MANHDEIIRNLKREIEDLEKEIAEKMSTAKSVLIPGMSGAPRSSNSFAMSKEYKELAKDLKRKKNLLATYEMGLIGREEELPKMDLDAMRYPEYRKGGYFTSQDYYDKCDEFHRILEEHGEEPLKLPRNEYIYLKKEFFKNMYGITWLAEEEQFMPGTNIEVIAERLN